MKKYDDEFKQSAVKKILDGQSVASVARELGVGEGLLHTAVGNERVWHRLLTPSARLSNCARNYVKSRWSAIY
jgi:transposase-like protein